LTPKRQVTTKRLVPDGTPREVRRNSMRNLYAEHDGNLGVVKMNKEHRFNILSEGMISDINRGLDTMNNDHAMHAIYLGTEKG